MAESWDSASSSWLYKRAEKKLYWNSLSNSLERAFRDWGKGQILEIYFTVNLVNGYLRIWICRLLFLVASPISDEREISVARLFVASPNASLKLAPNMKSLLPQLRWLSLTGSIKIFPCLGLLSICGYTFILAGFFSLAVSNSARLEWEDLSGFPHPHWPSFGSFVGALIKPSFYHIRGFAYLYLDILFN